MNQRILALLYRSFEEQLSPTEQQELDCALVDSAALRAERDRINQLRTLISTRGQRSFRPFFAEKVLRKIREQRRSAENFANSLVEVFRPITIAVATVLIFLLGYNFFLSEDKSLASAIAEPEIKLEQALDPTITWIME